MPVAAHRSLALQLALAGMLLRALLPVGWMPASTLASGTWLEICDGITPSAAQPHMARGGMPAMGHPMPGHMRGKICPFAAAAHLARADNTPYQAFYRPLSWRLEQQAMRHLAHRAPPLDASSPRGPPQRV